jgi:hypothetical protein
LDVIQEMMDLVANSKGMSEEELAQRKQDLKREQKVVCLNHQLKLAIFQFDNDFECTDLNSLMVIHLGEGLTLSSINTPLWHGQTV